MREQRPSRKHAQRGRAATSSRAGRALDQPTETAREEDLSAEQARQKAPARLPRQKLERGRREGAEPAPREGQEAPVGLSRELTPSRLETLKRRSEFNAVRGGARWSCPSFLIEARPRASPGPASDATIASGPRIGFTVTRKLGSAVVRNRIRRRLKEAARHLAARHARPECDYVLIAREGALNRPFSDLVQDLATALDRVNRRLPRP
jgi:ribonuclease P protein component